MACRSPATCSSVRCCIHARRSAERDLDGAARFAKVAVDGVHVADDELHRDALETERWNMLHPGETPRVPYVTRALADAEGSMPDPMNAAPSRSPEREASNHYY